MTRSLGVTCVLLGAFAQLGTAAETALHACALLTAGELTAAGIGAAGEPHESTMDVPNGAGKSQPMGLCMWKVGDKGMVSVAFMRGVQGAQREEGLAKLREVFAQLKTKGWKEEKSEFSGGSCSLLMPPASEKDAPHMTGCFAEARGMVISATTMTATQDVAIAKVKVLLDQAFSRLP